MSIFEIAQKVSELFKGRTIYFDFKSYDYEDDIPHIYDGSKRCNVNCVRFNDKGDFFEVITDTFACGISFNDTTEDEFDDEASEMGLYQLLKDVYYETDDSVDLGDFESDFLGIPWWDLSR